MGIILFYLHYIIAGILLYHILRCIYVKGSVTKGSFYEKNYEKTNSDKRLTHPLWIIILFLIVLCIPILNLVVFILYLVFKLISDSGSKCNPYYCKSIFTKKY